MKQTIIGREKEKRILNELFKSEKSEFLALYGRRRVGKTFLIKNFFESKDCLFFYSSGLKDGSLVDQIEGFTKQIGDVFYCGAGLMPRTRWVDAFEDLSKAISQIALDKKIVLFFDELPWMVTPRSGLLQAIDHYWNRYWSHDSRMKLVVCGSSASWIIENIINNKGGLYNRVTRTIHLDPFTLNETEAFLQGLGSKLNRKQMLQLYMVFGGVPHYLALVRKGRSAMQLIDELCFQKGGALVYEFERLFAALFSDADTYINLVRQIAKHPSGIGLPQLVKETGMSGGGRLAARLDALMHAGFILEFVPYGHQEKGVYYKVIDEFTLFYLRWVEPNMRTILKQDDSAGFWLAKTKSPHWKAWSGLAFEAVCYKHLAEIRRALNIDAGAAIGSWRYVPRQSDETGAQIDLLFDRDDGAITVCEIKYNQKPFAVDKDYAHNLLNKVDVYKRRSKTDKQIFITIVAAHGLKPTMYSEEIVDDVVVLDDLFK